MIRGLQNCSIQRCSEPFYIRFSYLTIRMHTTRSTSIQARLDDISFAPVSISRT